MAQEKDVTTPVGKFKCNWCAERYNNNLEKYNHERTNHVDEFKERAAERVANEEAGPQERRDGRQNGSGYSSSHQPYEETRRVAGLYMAELHEYTKKFATAMQSAAPSMAESRKQQLILKFDEEAGRYSQEPQLLDRFLLRAGMTTSQTEYIKLVMLPIDGGQPGPGYPGSGIPGQPQGWTLNPQTGQMTPIIVMGGTQQPQVQSQPNMPFIMMPPTQPQLQHDPNTLTRYEMLELVEKIAEKLKPVPQEPPRGHETPMRRYQQLITDAEGNAVKHPDTGEVLYSWVEEPVALEREGLTQTVELLRTLGMVGQAAPPTAEEIAKETVKIAAPLMPAQPSGPSPEVLELSRKLDLVLNQKDREEAVREAVEQAGTRFTTQMQPLLSELDGLRKSQGLSDHQAGLAHEESMQKSFLVALTQTFSGFRSDLQPLFMQGMVAQMKALGLQDQTIIDLVAKASDMKGPVAEDPTGAKAAAMQRWVQP